MLPAVAVVALMVSTAAAATTTMKPMMATSMAPPSKPCCLPKRWQASLMDLKSPSALQYITLYAYDHEKSIEGSIVVEIQSEKPIFQTYVDYSAMMKYTVDFTHQNQSCKQEKPSHKLYDACFTDTNATYLGSAKIGGDQGVVIDGWSMTIDDISVAIQLTRGQCAIILENVKEDDHENLILFNDFTETVTESQLLVLPAACRAAASNVIG